MRALGRLRFYGLATWECFRRPPGDPLHLSLSDVTGLAVRAGGVQHGFRYVQLPVGEGRGGVTALNALFSPGRQAGSCPGPVLFDSHVQSCLRLTGFRLALHIQ